MNALSFAQRAWDNATPDYDAPVEVDHAAAVMDALLEVPIASLLRDDAPEAAYAEYTPETALGELLCCSRITGIHDDAMSLILLAARGQSVAEAARTLLQRLANEYAELKQ